ncbi:MAG: protein NrnU [Rhodoferax sp.]|nr:MAG: protein NrnU [Rhodoferax sp.]
MTYLIIGLVLFLGVHSVRIFAEDWRARQLQARGEAAYKGVYSVLSLLGFALIVYGFGVAREAPVVLWVPPVALRHAAALVILVAFVLLAAAYVPGNAIKARVHHPMVLGVKTWALAHLLTTGRLETVLLFGAFLLWAVLNFAAARKRDRLAGMVDAPTVSRGATVLAVLLGGGAYAVFAVLLHGMLIGIRPFG